MAEETHQKFLTSPKASEFAVRLVTDLVLIFGGSVAKMLLRIAMTDRFGIQARRVGRRLFQADLTIQSQVVLNLG